MALFVAPLASHITRLRGTRTTLMLGVVLETAALLGASFSNSIWQLYLSQGVCFGLGMGFQYISTVPIIPQWFSTRRGLAAGIAAGGSGTGGLIYSLAIDALIKQLGIAWTLRVLAAVQATVNTVCALLIRDRNRQIGTSLASFRWRLFRRLEYQLFLGWSVFSMLGFVVLLLSLADYATSVGLTAHQGSVLVALLNVGQAVGRPTVGLLSDTVGRLNIATLTTFFSGLLCFVMWTFAKSYPSLIVFSLLAGSVFGIFWTVSNPQQNEECMSLIIL